MISRKRWTRVPKTAPVDGPKHTAVLHHTVTSDKPRTRAQEREHMRELRSMHLNRGFVDIGYNGVLFRSGRLYEGRGFDRIPAAQSNANSGTVAIAYAGNGELRDMSRRARLRLRLALINLRVNRGVRNLRGHRDFGGTVCPGDIIYQRIQKLRRFTGLK